MPVYLVRWPELRASLIQAPDETALVRYLDEVEDPSQCRWTEYDGPLWIDLTVPSRILPRCPPDRGPESLAECEITGAKALAVRVDDGEPLFDAALGPLDSDASADVQANVLRWAFPDLGRVLLDADPEQLPDPAAVQGALEREVESLLAYNRDPEAFCAAMEALRAAAREVGEEDDAEGPTEVVIVGEFVADGAEYQVVLHQETDGAVEIERVVAKRRRAGEVVEIRTDFVGTARWDGATRSVVPAEDTPAEALPLLGAAQEALRRELAREAN